MAQVFEFHFNPKTKEDIIFDSFCYEPENIYEKRVGSLYMLGILKNVLPQNVHFLEKLAKVIKEKYYRTTLIKPEKSLKNSLKEANEFLENIAKKGDVSWLGNLNFGVISIKNFELNFTRVGDLKFFLIRKGQVIDIDQKLKLEEIEPYPLKVFGNIVSGKLTENDILLALTKDTLETFQSQNLIKEIAQIIPFGEKKLKQILDNKHDILSKISGVCLLIFLSKDYTPPTAREVISPKPVKFSLKQVFIPVFNRLSYFRNLIKKPEIKIPKIPTVNELRSFSPFAMARVPKIPLPALPHISFRFKKNLILIFALAVFLALGFFVAQKEEKQRIENYQETLREIEAKVEEAESYLILKETKPEASQKANLLLKDSWNAISPLSKIAPTLPSELNSKISSLKETISINLYQLNKLEIIEEPKILFEFNRETFVPQKIVAAEDKLYFFNSYSENLFLRTGEGKEEVIQIDKKFNAATTIDKAAVFFSKPDQLTILENGKINLSPLETLSDFDYDLVSSYKSSLYFLDKKKGEIIKYPYRESFNWGSPQFWLAPQAKKAISPKSMAVDGSVWFLNKDNSLTRYYGGWPQETITAELFPTAKNFSQIVTIAALPYLYLLEPDQSRVIVLDKSGQIFKQFQSQKFDNLLDLAVSGDGKTIYLLNELKVFTLTLL